MTAYKQGYFYIEGMGEDVVEGYTNGDNWNGWATPVFTFENAKKVIGMIEHNSHDSRYDEKSDSFLVTFEEGSNEVETFEGMDIVVDGETVKVYPLGAYSWVWEELENVKKFSNDPYFSDGGESLILLSYTLGEGHSYAEVDFIIYNDNPFRWYVQVSADSFNSHEELLEELKKEYYWGEGASVTL